MAAWPARATARARRIHVSAETDVLVLGGAGVDTIVYVPELPLAYADSYMVPAIRQRAGQTGDFVAMGVSALGLRVHHLDVVGDDPEGDLVRALHRDKGIPFTEVPSPQGTKRAVNLVDPRSEEHTSELQSRSDLVCRLLLEKKNKIKVNVNIQINKQKKKDK